MKKTMLTVAIALVALTGFSQEASTNKVEERIQQRVEVMTEQLDLTEVQQKQLYQLYKDEVAERKAASSAKAQAVRANKKHEMEQKRNAYNKRLKTILTPEQYEKWKALKENENAKNKQIRN